VFLRFKLRKLLITEYSRKCIVIELLVFFLQRSVGTFGLTGLDRLLCFMIVKELQNYQILMNRTVQNPKDRSWLEALGSFVKIVQPLRGLIGKK